MAVASIFLRNVRNAYAPVPTNGHAIPIWVSSDDKRERAMLACERITDTRFERFKRMTVSEIDFVALKGNELCLAHRHVCKKFKVLGIGAGFFEENFACARILKSPH